MLFLLVLGRRRRRFLGQDDKEPGALKIHLGLNGAGVVAPRDREHLEEACPLGAVDLALAADLQLPAGAVQDLQLLLPEP